MLNELSMEESENLIANFQNISGNPLADFLKDLSDISNIQLPAQPPVIGDQIGNVRMLRSARKGIFVFAAQAIIITTAIAGAAALSGFAPSPIVNFAKSTAHNLSVTFKKVAEVITGNTPEILARYEAENTGTQLPTSPIHIEDSLANLIYKEETADKVSNLGSNPQVTETDHETVSESASSNKNEAANTEQSNENANGANKASEIQNESKVSPEPTESKAPETNESAKPVEIKTPDPMESPKLVEIKTPEPVEVKTPEPQSTEAPEVEK